jgi:hypothetical protein
VSKRLIKSVYWPKHFKAFDNIFFSIILLNSRVILIFLVYGSNTEGGNNQSPVGSPSKIDIQLSGSTSIGNSGGNGSGGVQLSESALAQRRSAYLPKLRQLSSNVTNLSFEHGVSSFNLFSKLGVYPGFINKLNREADQDI